MYFKKEVLLNKRYLSILFILLTYFIFVGCSTNEVEYSYTQYKFPLQKEDIQEVLKQNNLSRTLNTSNSKSKGHTHHLLVNNQNKLICSIDSHTDNYGRYLKIAGFPQKVEETELIYESEWQDVFKFTCILYGNPNQYQTIYNEFTNYIRSRKNNEIKYWRTRIDDEHVVIYFSPIEDDTEKYYLNSITIMNNNSFEALLKSREKIWKDILTRLEIESMGKLNISEIISMSDDDTDFIKGVMVEGHLKNIKKLKKSELYKVIPKSEFISYNETFLTAELVDDTGSIPVVLRSTSLNKEELGEVRKHYMYYFSSNNACIINFSVR